MTKTCMWGRVKHTPKSWSPYCVPPFPKGKGSFYGTGNSTVWIHCAHPPGKKGAKGEAKWWPSDSCIFDSLWHPVPLHGVELHVSQQISWGLFMYSSGIALHPPEYGQKITAKSFSTTLRVMDVRAEDRGRPHSKVATLPAAPGVGRTFLTSGHPGVRVRNVRGKSGPQSLCLCWHHLPESQACPVAPVARQLPGVSHVKLLPFFA